jgi:hypothetical protein
MEAHKQIESYFVKFAEVFKDHFNVPDNTVFSFQKNTHQWRNFYYNSPIFRHIHLEFYKTNRICVLHANIFPNPHIDYPILGFDMIALGNKITGIFFDFTPILTRNATLGYMLESIKKDVIVKSENRALPEWADFFSGEFICVTPDAEEIDSLIEEVNKCINVYLKDSDKFLNAYKQNVNIQNNYCIGQKKNDKTSKALAAEVGEENAKLFLNNYLFPEIN